MCRGGGGAEEGPPNRVLLHPDLSCRIFFPIHSFETNSYRKERFSYLRVGACRVLREQYLGKFSELLEKSRRRRRERKRAGFLKSSGVPRRNSGVAKPGRGEEQRREQAVATGPGFGP